MSRAVETKDQEVESTADLAIDVAPVQLSASAGLQSRALMRLSPDSALATDPAAAQAAELRAASGPPVQRQETGETKSASAPAVAAAGVEGSGSPLPHLGRIQQSFGAHDVSGVSAHVGGAAATAGEALGAQAYATGNDVAFASAPDLHTAAHEAAHVVQQRGGVQLKGGVGQAGDVYEQHADAVADAVVRGESAAPLLDRFAGGGGGSSGVVQRQSIPAARDKSAGEPAKEEGSNENTPAPAKPTVKALSSKQVKAARKANDKAQFRIDWVRNLQQNIHPSKSRVSEDGSFDEETIRAIAAFQAEKGLGTKKPGLIDGAPERPWRPPFRRLQPLWWGPT